MSRIALLFLLAALVPGFAQEAQYRLGPGDIIEVRAIDAEEITDKPIKVGADGFINLNTVGRVQAAGRTVEELQSLIADRLKVYIKNPDVTVVINETHSQPISVLGAVNTPGVIQLSGKKTLVEVMSLAGGLKEDAGYTIRVTRLKEMGPLPLAGARPDPTGLYLVAEANIDEIMSGKNPAGNIQIRPNDVINVPKADLVYVIGDVLKAGAIALGSQKTVTVLQAVSIAAGVTRFAKADETKILRLTPGSTERTEIKVPLKKMLQGKAADIPMHPDDILFVPTSLKRELAFKSIESAAGNGLLGIIYRLP